MIKPLLWVLGLLVVMGVLFHGILWVFPEVEIFLLSLTEVQAYALSIFVGGTFGLVWLKLYEKFVE